jgi:hypothetical protein
MVILRSTWVGLPAQIEASAVRLGDANVLSAIEQKIGELFAKYPVVRKNFGAGA